MIKPGLPITLERVENLSDQATFDAKGKITNSYKSSDKKVVAVNKNGKVTAKKSRKSDRYNKSNLLH